VKAWVPSKIAEPDVSALYVPAAYHEFINYVTGRDADQFLRRRP